MGFIDNLALVEALLVLAAAVLTYVGVTGWWAMRKGDAKGLRNTLKSASIPVGLTGGAMLFLALYGEVTWPYGTAGGLAGYNIFFLDVQTLFALVMVAFPFVMYLSTRVQYMGFFALTAGAITLVYGYYGYTTGAGYTKDPFDTFLMYAGFAGAGIFAFPASIVVDLYLSAAEGNSTFWNSVATYHERMRLSSGVRGVGSMTNMSNNTEMENKTTMVKYHVPYYAQILLLLFPVFMALAGIAALWYFGTTLPGHLASPP